jgi:selenocysteine lyase/cysteine desulfurase
MAEALISKESFIGLDSCVWLYGGAESPPYIGSAEALNDYMRNRAMGPKGRELHAQKEASLRGLIATLLGGKAEHIALLSNASECISAIALALPFREGDNIVVNALEFPSGVLPWLRKKGVEMRVVPHNGTWEVSAEQMMERVDARTKLVVASHVSYLSGARLDYRKLYEQLKETDALFLLDATQSLGVVPVDLSGADIVVSSSYKWLLSVHGLGIMAFNPSRTEQLLPAAAGWRSVERLFHERRFETVEFYKDARRFELGYPSFPSIYAMERSVEALLEAGIGRIERHVLELGGRLIRELSALGFEVMTPEAPERRAGNISVVFARGEELADALSREGVLLWGGDGRIRASVHCFNDDADLDRLLELLPKLSRTLM